MTDTTKEVTSGVKLCDSCGATFGEDDDKRYKDCATCRGAVIEQPEVAIPEHDAGVEPVVLDIEKHKPPPIENRDFYWCGATMDCPMDITLGGFEFPRTEGRLVDQFDGSSILQPDATKGKIHRLTKVNVALIKEHCANKVIRNFTVEELVLLSGKVHNRYHGHIRGITGSKHRVYVPQPSDKPLGQFVYMVRVRHANDRPMSDPPTMVPRDW